MRTMENRKSVESVELTIEELKLIQYCCDNVADGFLDVDNTNRSMASRLSCIFNNLVKKYKRNHKPIPEQVHHSRSNVRFLMSKGERFK